jgi:carboxypeptidase PM20D1
VKRVLLGLAAVLLLLLVTVVLRAVSLESTQVEVAPVDAIPVDAAAVARRLADGIRFETVSYYDYGRFDPGEFRRFHDYLRETYPATHAGLELETVAGLSLLYTWRGSRPELKPALLAAHLDVVPVEAGAAEEWTYPPFAGSVADGYVWGRGAIDDKSCLFAVFEAVEGLLKQGFRPERTLYLAFGHDEEVGGDRGATSIADLLASRGVRIEYVLDEGGAIVVDPIPAWKTQIALVGIAEKGSATIDLVVESPGGHSSTPPRETAVGILSEAVVALQRRPMPARIDGATKVMLETAAGELSLPFRAVLANLWLFGPLLEMAMAREPSLDAMIRTTTAPTIIEGGVKENVLPRRARAAVNFRILPGDTVETVLQHVQSSVNDERVQIELSPRPTPRDPSRVSPVDTPAYQSLKLAIRQVFPDAQVVPYLVLGGTDARHYGRVSDALYRFAPFSFTEDDRTRVHGKDERMRVVNLGDAVRFYRQLLIHTAGPGQG